jgi:hypothetical protein
VPTSALDELLALKKKRKAQEGERVGKKGVLLPEEV